MRIRLFRYNLSPCPDFFYLFFSGAVFLSSFAFLKPPDDRMVISPPYNSPLFRTPPFSAEETPLAVAPTTLIVFGVACSPFFFSFLT